MKLKSWHILLIVFIGGLTLLSSCEEDITFEFSDYEEKIVIDGAIFEGEPAKVFITRSQSFFDSIPTDSVDIEYLGNVFTIPGMLYDLLVFDAEVIVSDGNQVDTLQLGIDPYTYPYLCYVGDPIVGQSGQSYTLSVTVGEEVVSSTTSIPSHIPIDSVWFEFKNDDEDSLGYIYGVFDDPVEEQNYYRFFSKSIGRDSIFVHPWRSVGYDQNVNGEEEVQFVLYHGNNSLEDSEDSDRWYFRLGEKVVVRFCTIDHDSFEFWSSFQENAGGSGNQFSSPSPTATNILGGLGVWCGYGVYDTLYTVQYIEETK